MTVDDDALTPAVLVVEDQPALLESRMAQLAQHGVTAIGAERAEVAAAFLAAARRPVNLVIIDVNLRPDDPSDRSGLALARLMRTAGLDVPIVGYSAHFEEGQISAEDRREFHAWIEKGRLLPREIAARYAELAQDVAAADRGAVMERKAAVVDGLVAFLAETASGADADVRDARDFLKASIGTRAYDPLDGAESPYDPFDGDVPYDPMANVRLVGAEATQ
jgi:CheY-like chemotaxis protein